jgi:hypothetical protein
LIVSDVTPRALLRSEVCDPTKDSELGDICFETTLADWSGSSRAG